MERSARIVGAVRRIEWVDTEWVYDLRQDWLVRTRFWVHDRAPASPDVEGRWTASQCSLPRRTDTRVVFAALAEAGARHFASGICPRLTR